MSGPISRGLGALNPKPLTLNPKPGLGGGSGLLGFEGLGVGALGFHG